jgi:hypothetical protein
MHGNKYKIQLNSPELPNLFPPVHAPNSSVPTTSSHHFSTARLTAISPHSTALYAVLNSKPQTPNPKPKYLVPHNTLFQLPAFYSGHPDSNPGEISGGQSGNNHGFSSFSPTAPSNIAPHSTSALHFYQKDKRAKPETF